MKATGNATAGQVLSGATFSNASANGLTGTMTNNGAGGTVTPGATAQTKPAGYYSSAITVSAVTFAPANVLVGTTIAGTAGTMPNRSAENAHQPGLASTVWAGDRFFIKPPAGYYNGGESWVTAPVPGLVAANIRSGVNVAGLIGTLKEGLVYSTGTFTSTSTSYTVTGLGGKPFFIVVVELSTSIYGEAVYLENTSTGAVIVNSGTRWNGAGTNNPISFVTSGSFNFAGEASRNYLYYAFYL
ncbi:hypothetical protein D3C76_932860 [compost metagenome]